MIEFLGLCIAGIILFIVGTRVILAYDPNTIGLVVHALGLVFIGEALVVVWPGREAVQRLWDRLRED